jgi:hypothetical protein
MGCLRVWLARQDTFVTITFFALYLLLNKSILRGPDNVDLRCSPLSPTAAPVVVHQDSVYASLNPLDVRLSLILGVLNLGIADSLLTVSISTVKCHLDLA